MTTQVATLSVQQRTVLGKKVSQLRRQGLTPVHLYGAGGEPAALQVDSLALRRVLSHVGHNRPVEVVTEGTSDRSLAFVREIQFHPLTLDVLHVDLFRVDAGLTTTVEVPVELVGDSNAVHLGGSLIQNIHTVNVEARPLDVPGSIEVDVSVLNDFEKSIRVADLVVPEGVTVLTDGEQMVAHVAAPVGAEAIETDGAPEAPPEPARVEEEADAEGDENS